MFANNLTDKLTGLVKYEITSITTNSGNNAFGTPLGTKKLKNFIPCIINPISVTPKNITIASAKVTIMWLVTVNV